MEPVSEKVRAHQMPPYVLQQEQTAIAPWIQYPKDQRHQARLRGKAAQTPGTPEAARSEMDVIMGLYNLLKGTTPLPPTQPQL